MKANIDVKLKSLEDLGANQLRDRWFEVFKTPPPKSASADFLHRAIAHQHQVDEHGGLKANAKRRLVQMAKAMEKDPDYSPGPAPSIKPGTTLIREWQGKRYEVMILETGFAFEGKTYDSLSRIASDITGTRWSGPLFFGLKGSGGNTKVRHAA